MPILNISARSRIWPAGKAAATAAPGAHMHEDHKATVLVENLHMAYRDSVALDGVSFEVPKGAFGTLLGPSGSGKTTILRCISGVEQPDSGRIVIGNRVVFDSAKKINLSPRERRLGMIFQDYALWPHLTVIQHVLFPLRAQGVSRTDSLPRAQAVLEQVGLARMARRFPHELSGGQQQRVAIARAIVSDPSVLLMDEPLSNLDAQLRQQLREELKLTHTRTGATSIFVTHDQAEAFALSDYLVLMRDGNVVQAGTVAEVRGAPCDEFAARFFGYLNTLQGAFIIRCASPDSATAAIDGQATYVINPSSIRLTRPDEPSIRFDNCRYTDAAFDGTIHSFRFSVQEVTLHGRALDMGAWHSTSVGDTADAQLWVRVQDLVELPIPNTDSQGE